MLKRKAFSLSEILLAIAIVGFVFGSIILTFLACFLLNESNRNLSIAVTHAQYILEEIKNSTATTGGFNNLINTTYLGAQLTTMGLSPLDNETISVNVINETGIKNVGVVVYWKDRQRDRNIILRTQINRP